eukprot:SM000003S11248  [mRNA]  locus=s3:1723598:1729805:+ [translate_table: standard]
MPSLLHPRHYGCTVAEVYEPWSRRRTKISSTHTAGQAVESAEQRKLLRYSDYFRSDHLPPATTGSFCCISPHFQTLSRIHRQSTTRDGHAGSMIVVSAPLCVNLSELTERAYSELTLMLFTRKLKGMSIGVHDHLLPAAIDTFGCLGPRFHTLLENIASLGYARREDMLPTQMGMPAAYLSFLRRLVSTCLQRAQAYALHQKAGRALAAGTRASQLPSGIRASASDLYVLTRGY